MTHGPTGPGEKARIASPKSRQKPKRHRKRNALPSPKTMQLCSSTRTARPSDPDSPVSKLFKRLPLICNKNSMHRPDRRKRSMMKRYWTPTFFVIRRLTFRVRMRTFPINRSMKPSSTPRRLEETLRHRPDRHVRVREAVPSSARKRVAPERATRLVIRSSAIGNCARPLPAPGLLGTFVQHLIVTGAASRTQGGLYCP